MSKRAAVLGAGPIGVEAALVARERGYDVRVYESETVGGNVKRWGHVELFSPWHMNHSARGVRLLRNRGVELPETEAYLSGAEHVERYLEPLAREALAGRIFQGTRVVGVSRDGLAKNDLIGGPRHEHAFRLLLENDAGEERIEEADLVIDATGTYRHHNWMGNGNLPALGERELEHRIAYELEDVSGGQRRDFDGKRVLLVGAGHSAATALEGLRRLDDVRIHWLVRATDGSPLPVIQDDPLPERQRLSERVNAVAGGGDARVQLHRGASVEALRSKEGALEVELVEHGKRTGLSVDRILAHVGFHPDNSIYRELQVHECYASMGPMKLSAALLGESSADCLAQTSKGAETLANPEPNFFILGAKSYGKNSNFLIRIGIEQVEEVFRSLGDAHQKEKVS